MSPSTTPSTPTETETTPPEIATPPDTPPPPRNRKSFHHVADALRQGATHLDDLLHDLDLSLDETQALLASSKFQSHRQLRTALLAQQLQILAQDHAQSAIIRLVDLSNSKHAAVARLACTQLLTYAGLSPQKPEPSPFPNPAAYLPRGEPPATPAAVPIPPETPANTPISDPFTPPLPLQNAAARGKQAAAHGQPEGGTYHAPPAPNLPLSPCPPVTLSHSPPHPPRLTPLVALLTLLLSSFIVLRSSFSQFSIHNPSPAEYALSVPASERPAMPDAVPPSPSSPTTLTANLIDIPNRRIYPATLTLQNGRIQSITEGIPQNTNPPQTFLLPGFIDAHIHIESSMLIPTEFARLALPHGTVATVSDPHEIANVLGPPGIHFMLDNAAQTPLKIAFGAPPCVPATPFETAGATLTPDDIRDLLQHDRVRYLAEVMNYPGVIAGNPDLLAKIAHAQAAPGGGKPIDGHAPALRGQGIPAYFNRGISTDHECFTLDEALEKLAAAPHLHILIREGSAAKNFDALHPLLRSHPQRIMFCSDDKHPHELEEGHINAVVARAIALGYDLFDVLRAACITPVRHYHLPVGTLRPNDPADFIEVADLASFQVLRTFIDGTLVAQNNQCLLPPATPLTTRPNKFAATPITPDQLALPIAHSAPGIQANIIEAFDGQLVTARLQDYLPIHDGLLSADPTRDLLKLIVLNRYSPSAPPAIAFIKGFKLQRGAIASSVAHDSHNIVAVGTSDQALAQAINLVITEKGGLSLVDGPLELTLPLPIAGILTDADAHHTAHTYRQIDQAARALSHHTGMSAPFMTLSFMPLLVIPSLKLSDQGLFDADSFRFLPLLET
jgi:adenine deaminase